VRVLLDENVSPELVPILEADGFDAKHSVASCGRGASDEQVMAFALHDQRAIVTHDRDFGLLAARRRERGLPPCSVVLLRPGAASVHEVRQALHETRALANEQPLDQRWGWFAVASLRFGRAAIRFRGA